MKYLSEQEIYELLVSQGLIENINISSKELYINYINYLSERNIHCEKFILKCNEENLTHKDVAIELSKLLANKIELGSEEFWSLFSYKQSNYLTNWKNNNNNWEEQEGDIYRENQKNYLSTMYKKENVETLAYFLENYPHPKSELIKLWFYISKSNKEIKLKIEPYNFIDTYGKSNKENHLLMRAKMYALFDHPIAIKKITELYEIYKGKEFGLLLEKILKEKDPSFIAYEPLLFEEYQTIIYKKVINIEKLALVKKYNIIPNVEADLLNIIEYTLNFKSKQFNFDTKININNYIPTINKHISSFEIITYSETQLEKVSQWFKDLINNLDIIFEDRGRNLFYKNYKNKYYATMTEFAELLDATITYKNFENQIPDKKYTSSKKKI